jgi:hypothetical protein
MQAQERDVVADMFPSFIQYLLPSPGMISQVMLHPFAPLQIPSSFIQPTIRATGNEINEP